MNQKTIGSSTLGVARGKINTLFSRRLSSSFQLPASNSGRRFIAAFTFLVIAHPLSAHACAVCFGNKDSLQTKGSIAGVLFLLGVIGVVLAGLAVTFIRWGVRERGIEDKYNDPLTQHLR